MTAAVILAVTGRTADIATPNDESSTVSDIEQNSFEACWEAIADAASYRLDVAEDPDFQHILADYNNLVVSGTTCQQVAGLISNNDYYWRVRSVNEAGGQSASSAARRVKTAPGAGDTPPQTKETDEDIEEQLAPYTTYRSILAELDIHRTFYRDGCYNTICLPFALSQEYIDTCAYFTNSSIYEYTSATLNNGQLDLEINPVTSMEAGIPYLIKWTPMTPEIIPSPLKFYNVNISTVKGDSVGPENDILFVGHIGKKQIELNQHYNLFVGSNNTLYWPDDTNSKMKGFRAYFALPHETPAGAPIHRGMPARLVEHQDTTTDITPVSHPDGNTLKILKNGQMIICRDGKCYTILGGLAQ